MLTAWARVLQGDGVLNRVTQWGRRFGFLMLHLVVAAGSARAESMHVAEYQVELRPDFAARTITGVTRLDVVVPPRVGDLRFTVHDLIVDEVRVDGARLPVGMTAKELSIPMEPPGESPRRAQVSVRYHGASPDGLVWGPGTVHTTFYACAWMICREDTPGDRSRLTLELVLPRGIGVVASGRETRTSTEPGGLVRHVWTERRARPNYLFGFAAGGFVTASLSSPALEAVGVGLSSARLRRLFHDTDRMRRFFEAKAGVRLVDPYRQVLVEDDEAQEATSFSLIGRRYLEPILRDPTEDWVIAHELSHQWWGNLITCATWQHFWLNEGMAVFMTAAYKEARWGRAKYEREMDIARSEVEDAARAGFDVPLAFDGEYPSLRIKRDIVYAKGALFLDALRRELGDASFWRGIRLYTRRFAGKSVVSRDFQAALEEASGQDLSLLFDEWVYPPER